jgi:hypothetical protein
MYTVDEHGIKDQSETAYYAEANKILSSMVSRYPESSPEFDEFVFDFDDNIAAIKKHPYPEPYMEWTDYNVRYGYKRSISGTLAEKIVELNLVSVVGWNIRRALSLEDQAKKQVDLFFTDKLGIERTVQAKAVRFWRDELCQAPPGYTNIKTDYLALVDISMRHCYIIETQKAIQYLAKGGKQMCTFKNMATHYFNNHELYDSTQRWINR